jgi:hypothetical protein
MLSGFLKKIAVLSLIATAATLAAPTTAKAVVVTYSTTGQFDINPPAYPGTDPAAVTVGTTTVTFNGVTRTVDTDETGSNSGFGSFVVSGGTSVDQALAGHTFNLFITQVTPPGANHATFTSLLSGTVRINNSKAYVEFQNPLSQTVVAADGTNTTYLILNSDKILGGSPVPGTVALNAPQTGGLAGNPSTINGFVTAVVPEPTTMASAVIGLVLFAGAARFRSRKSA